MALTNYFMGLKRGEDGKPQNVQAGTATVGTAVDVEVRLMTNNGSNATGLTRNEAVLLLETIANWIEQGGAGPGAGANLPVL